MIELTDEQIEMLHEQLNAQGGAEAFNDVGDFEEYVWSLNEIIDALKEFLTLPQIKQLAEQYNASVVQWIEFDVDDESTWPPSHYNDTSITVYTALGKARIDRYAIRNNGVFELKWFLDNGTMINLEDLTHWAYLPTVKEK